MCCRSECFATMAVKLLDFAWSRLTRSTPQGQHRGHQMTAPECYDVGPNQILFHLGIVAMVEIYFVGNMSLPNVQKSRGKMVHSGRYITRHWYLERHIGRGKDVPDRLLTCVMIVVDEVATEEGKLGVGVTCPTSSVASKLPRTAPHSPLLDFSWE
jgi:hypothetical protein